MPVELFNCARCAVAESHRFERTVTRKLGDARVEPYLDLWMFDDVGHDERAGAHGILAHQDRDLVSTKRQEEVFLCGAVATADDHDVLILDLVLP